MTIIAWATVAAVVILSVDLRLLLGERNGADRFLPRRDVAAGEAGQRDATVVNRLLATRERLLGAVLFANNLTNIAAATLMTGLLLDFFGQAGELYATLVMTLLIFVVAEVLPKTAAFNIPDRMALAVARPVTMTVRVFSPVLQAVEWLVRVILRGFGLPVGKIQSILSPREELRGTVDLMHRAGVVEKADRDMMGGLLDLRELMVSDVMVHRTKMVMLDADEPPQDIVDAVLAATVTRLPLWRGSPDNILGVLHAKDMLRALHAAGGDASKIDVGVAGDAALVRAGHDAALRTARRVPRPQDRARSGGRRIWRAGGLGDARRHRRGDRRRHHRRARYRGPRRARLPDGSVNVDGAVPVRDLNRAMDWNIPDDEATTIAGVVIHEARSIPEPGQSFTFHGFRFQVLRKTSNRITAFRVTPLARKAKGGGEGELTGEVP